MGAGDGQAGLPGVAGLRGNAMQQKRTALREPDVRSRLQAMAMVVTPDSGNAETFAKTFAKTIATELEFWAGVAKAANSRAE